MKNDKFAILKGAGNLPSLVIEKLIKDKIDFIEVDLSTINMGEVGVLLDKLKSEGVNKIIMAGSVVRPNLNKIKLDKDGVKLVALITKNKIFGDDNLLKTVNSFIENHGFEIVAVDDILDNITARPGPLTKLSITNKEEKDIEIARDYLNISSKFDIGQSVIVQKGLIIAVEGIEGTDKMIERVADYNSYPGEGFLVKLKKIGQDHRVDIPTIGVNTLKNVLNSKLKGVVIGAGSTYILNRDEVVEFANNHSLVIYSIG